MKLGIEINNIKKHFGSTCALDGVSMKLDDSRIYGLLGNNGAGKTTLLSIITNRIYADGGEVKIDGERVEDNDRILGKVFLMSEQNLYPDDMRVNKALSATAMFYPDFDAAYADKLARSFGLGTKKKIKALSTGYASIFRLIVALSVNTPYLLLDEPVLGLDAQHRDMFYKLLIEKFSEHPCTILVSTHLIQEISSLIEHTFIISGGRIIKDMPRDELLSGCYTVTGPAGLVTGYIGGREVISVKSLGGLKTAYIQGTPDESELAPGLEIGSVNLQDYFISLMSGKEDGK